MFESRGSYITGRLANLYPERFTAFGFLSSSYYAPVPDFDYQQLLAATKQAAGYELFGYWEFFSEEGAHKLVEEHVCNDPLFLSFHAELLMPVGLLPEYIVSRRPKALGNRYGTVGHFESLHSCQQESSASDVAFKRSTHLSLTACRVLLVLLQNT